MARLTSLKLLSIAPEDPCSKAAVEGAEVKIFTPESLALCRLWAPWAMWPMKELEEDPFLRITCEWSPMSGGRIQTWSRGHMTLDLSWDVLITAKKALKWCRKIFWIHADKYNESGQQLLKSFLCTHNLILNHCLLVKNGHKVNNRLKDLLAIICSTTSLDTWW